MEYSKSQLEAINHLKGPALVLAVPGSGKTTILLARINNLIKNGVNPDSILAMTFSKSQAIDMEQRYKKKYGVNKIKFSTIHSFAYKIIRTFYKGKKLELIESNNQYNKYKVVSDIYFKVKRKKMNDEQLESFFRVSSFLKNTLMNYEDYKDKYNRAFSGFEKVYEDYEIFKHNRNLMDFDDMLIIALKILQNNKVAINYLQKKFEYIQIDEGQDTSFVQLKIISLIAKPNNNLFIVADDDQSIYGFRGASSANLLDFPNNYPNAKIYYMENNYRSTNSIIHISNKLISNNKKRYDKKIISTIDDEKIVTLTRTKNTSKQSELVIEEAIKDVKNGETAAILYRNNISAINIINKIPDDTDFYIKDGKLSFYSNQLIQDIIDTINFSIDQYDFKSFKRIYYKFNLYIKKDFVNQIKFMDSSLNVIDRLKECEGINDFFLEKIYLLSYHLDKLSKLEFYNATKYILYDMDYYEYLREYIRRTASSPITYDRIIDTLLNISKNIKTIKEFEDKIKYLIEKQKSHSFKYSKLTLSTIHGSKGLEFDNVYLIDLLNNEFPTSYAASSKVELGALEEERRLLYVGITRAKHNLTITFPKKLYTSDVDKSVFIKEIIE